MYPWLLFVLRVCERECVRVCMSAHPSEDTYNFLYFWGGGGCPNMPQHQPDMDEPHKEEFPLSFPCPLSLACHTRQIVNWNLSGTSRSFSILMGVTSGCRPKCLWTELDRPTTNHSNETGDADEKTSFSSAKALSAAVRSFFFVKIHSLV